jgi:tetratricopeptide (TPR) repeat protein
MLTAICGSDGDAMTKTTMTGFQLFKSGRLEEALAAFNDDLASTKTPAALSNRAGVYLALRNYAAALEDYSAADDLQYTMTRERSDAYRKRIGGALWLLNRREEAETTWYDIVRDLKRGRIQFSDASGGAHSALLLFFAGVFRISSTAIEEAEHYFRGLNSAATEAWPGPIAEFVLGRVDYRELISVAQKSPQLMLRRACQASFYGGVCAHRRGDVIGPFFSVSVDYGAQVPLEIEYFFAAHELANLAAQPSA